MCPTRKRKINNFFGNRMNTIWNVLRWSWSWRRHKCTRLTLTVGKWSVHCPAPDHGHSPEWFMLRQPWVSEANTCTYTINRMVFGWPASLSSSTSSVDNAGTVSFPLKRLFTGTLFGVLIIFTMHPINNRNRIRWSECMNARRTCLLCFGFPLFVAFHALSCSD